MSAQVKKPLLHDLLDLLNYKDTDAEHGQGHLYNKESRHKYNIGLGNTGTTGYSSKTFVFNPSPIRPSVRSSVPLSIRSSVCPSICPSVGPLVGHAWVENAKNAHLWYCSLYHECGRWVGCPCPPIRNHIVTPLHLFSISLHSTCNLKAFWASSSAIALFFLFAVLLHTCASVELWMI